MKKRYFILFILFLILLSLSPISGDDWGNYLEGMLGIRHMIGQAIGMYFSWEGRFISRLLINILTCNKWLWNIINSICIISIIYYINKLINSKDNKNIFYLSILTILLMNIYTMNQTITWLAGNITYLFPICLLLIYIYYLKIDKQNFKFIIALLNLIIPMFIEHMAIILIIINIFICIYKYIKLKKIPINYIINLIISILSTSLMLLSPGSHLRSLSENVYFNSLNIIDKVIYNIPNFIYYTFIINSFMLILFIISYIYLINKNILNKYLKILLILFVSIYPIINIIVYNLSIININNYNYLINSSNYIIITYWAIFSLLYIYLLFRNKSYESIFYVILGYLANFVMLLSPTWGQRTSLATYIFIIMSLLLIIKNIKINNFIYKLIKSVTIITFIVYIIAFTNIYILNVKRENLIKEELAYDYDTIEVIKLPGYAPCNINPENEYHIKIFKRYYNISEDKNIVLK